MSFFAYDYVSVRSFDRDGRLRVERANISKSNVCPYLGSEIPLDGLDPNREYRLYRDPDELAAAASTFNSIPLLARHIPVSADDHKPNDVVGATGSDARFEAPYLTNSLIVWATSAIRAIESGETRELSPAYRYVCDMRPGVSPEGEAFDGRMRDLHANHLALVPRGRTGPDVVVGDGLIVPNSTRDYYAMFPNARRLK